MKERNQVNFEAKKVECSFSHFETCDALKLAIESGISSRTTVWSTHYSILAHAFFRIMEQSAQNEAPGMMGF